MRITKNLAAFSFVAAAALSIPSTGALAVTCIASDTLQVGTQTQTICEGSSGDRSIDRASFCPHGVHGVLGESHNRAA